MVADRKHVSFMYSYPNYIPLPASAVERIVQAVEPFEYDRVYGAFWDTVIERDGKAAVKEVGGTVSSSHQRITRLFSGDQPTHTRLSLVVSVQRAP